jgi:hypothetical protein
VSVGGERVSMEVADIGATRVDRFIAKDGKGLDQDME